MPQLEDARVRVSCVLREVDRDPLSLVSPTMPSFFSKLEPREYALRRSDGGRESCWKRMWAWAGACRNREST